MTLLARPLVQLALIVAAFTAGFTWALPAAGIGVVLGFALIANGVEGWAVLRLLGWLWRRGRPRPAKRAPSGAERREEHVARAVAVVVLALLCAVVAWLAAAGHLEVHGLNFLPAVLPFLLLTGTLPSVVAQLSRDRRAAHPSAAPHRRHRRNLVLLVALGLVSLALGLLASANDGPSGDDRDLGAVLIGVVVLAIALVAIARDAQRARRRD